MGAANDKMYIDKGYNMKLRQLFMQEIIRASALGLIVFLLLTIVQESLRLTGGELTTLSGIIILGIFLTFTTVRAITGKELMARTKRDWIIVGITAFIILGVIIGVAIITGQLQRVLRFGPWSIVVGLFFIALFTWLGYRTSVKHR
jgi:hypothetical protein